jgi:hypothetical protein
MSPLRASCRAGQGKVWLFLGNRVIVGLALGLMRLSNDLDLTARYLRRHFGLDGMYQRNAA